MSRYIKSLFFLLSTLLLIGCAGTKTFHELARAGDTVAVAAGYKHHFQRDNITVTITDANGATTVYDPSEVDPVTEVPRVRAVVNLYPDPLSSWVVSNRTGISQTPDATIYVGQNLFHNTKNDYDWWQTVAFVNLPVTMESNGQPMAVGDATVRIETPAGPDQEVHEAIVKIVSGTGQAHNFNAITQGNPPSLPQIEFGIVDRQMQALERVPHAILELSGSNVPYAVQVDLSHAADQDNGGNVGAKAYISNPVGHIKSVSWHDDGINTRIIMLPNRDSDITDLKDFKLYLAGITGWTVVDTQAFNQDGSTTGLEDVSASVIP